MAQDKIRQAADEATNETVYVSLPEYLLAKSRVENSIITALTYGWNGPDKVPDVDGARLQVMVMPFGKTKPVFTVGKVMYSEIVLQDLSFTNMPTILAWRYDNAQDIYELLKANGTV